MNSEIDFIFYIDLACHYGSPCAVALFGGAGIWIVWGVVIVGLISPWRKVCLSAIYYSFI